MTRYGGGALRAVKYRAAGVCSLARQTSGPVYFILVAKWLAM